MPRNFVEVIPLVRLPRSLEVFDYCVPKTLAANIHIGQVAQIPFRGKQMHGIIAAIKNSSSFERVQELSAIIDPQPLVSEKTLALFRNIADASFVSLGLFLRGALPETPKKIPIITSPEIQQPTLPMIAQYVAQKLAETLQFINTHSESVIWGDDPLFAQGLLLRLALRATQKKQPLLILFPIQEQAIACASFLQTYNIQAGLTLPTDAKIKTYTLWRAFEQGTQPIVIGTRNALFFPMKKHGCYVLFDDMAEEWKQSDMNPRIDARTLLPVLTKHFEATSIIMSPLPALSTWRTHQANIFDARILSSPQTTLTTFDPKDILSERLCEEGVNKKNILLFTHRKGSAILLRCQDCAFTATCPVCKLSLAVHKTFLRCTACKQTSDLPLTCPNCNGSDFISYGVGSEHIESRAKEQFPNARITITTSVFLNTWSLISETPAFDLVAIIEADGMLHRPDFRAQEKLARIVNHLGIIAAKHNAPFIIQTQFADLPVWKSTSETPELFYNATLEEREALHAPPFWKIIKLLFQNKNEKIARAQAEKITRALQKILSSHAEVSAPYPATPPQIRGNYHFLGTIRCAPDAYQHVQNHLKTIGDDIVIDVDATDILR